MTKSKPPELGWTTEATVVRVLDGDTVEVAITRTFKIRLLDPNNIKNKLFGAQEHDTDKGKEAIEFLSKLLPHSQKVTIHIPSHDPLRMLDVHTFDRLLGFVWLNDENLSEKMLKGGHASHNQKDI